MGSLLKILLRFMLPILIIILVFTNLGVLYGVLLLIAIMLFFVYKNMDMIYRYFGNKAYAVRDMDKSLAMFEKAASCKFARTDTKILYGYLLLKSGFPEKAGKIFDEIINKSLLRDEKNLAKSNLALVKWKNGEIDVAISMLEDVIRDYKNTNIYGSLGYLYTLSGDLEKSLKFNLEAYAYNDTSPVILDNLAQVYFLRKELDNAKEIYDKLINMKPAFPEAYYNYSLFLLENGEEEEAVKQLKKAKEYNFNYLSTIKKRDIDELLAQLERNNSYDRN